jgi:hypothetical protein
LNNKGKALRNKQKKLDKIVQTEKGVKKGEIQPTDAQKEMLEGKAALQAEIKELQELCDLYLKSKDYNTAQLEKEREEKEKAEGKKADPEQVLATALEIVSKLYQIQVSEKWTTSQTKSIEYLRKATPADLVKLTKLSNDSVCEGGITFFALHAFVEAQHHKQELEADNGDEVVSDGALDLCDDFDVFDCDAPAPKKVPEATPAAPAEKKAEPTPAPAVTVAAEAPVVVEESKEAVVVADETSAELGEKQEGGDRRGGRGDYRGRRGDGRGRGEYRGRGGHNRAPREDEDGFIVETGEKPKPRRDNRGRGRGDFRGGDRRGGRGEFRGERGGERGDRRGGNRPKTEGTTQPAEQQ